MKHNYLLHFIITVAVAIFMVACANMGSPDGGPFDETPPRIVHTSPAFGKTNAKSTKVVIEFDEIIKLENAQEKVVISPPQIEQPEIEASGRKITVTLLDSLKPNYTYTIDFADAISDNNEGNSFGDYAFTFSTGESIDTMQVSGCVLNAADLEPIKGMLVGLYRVGDIDDDNVAQLPDSVFRTTPFERISRTDSRGHFVIKGLSNGKYRVLALDDKNQNYVYDQRSEAVAFTRNLVVTSSAPDIRRDTVWHDSIHYDSIITVPYTHYYPDDIALMAFQTAKQDQHLVKSERLEPRMFSLYFTARSEELPRLTGLNFDSEGAFVVDASEHHDTINYWIRDSLIYNIDTLNIKVDFLATDTTGTLVETTDTLYLVSKLTKAKIAKQQEEKWEKWAKEYRQKVKQERKTRKKDDGAPADSLAVDGNLLAANMTDSLDSVATDSLGVAIADSLKVKPEPVVPAADDDVASSDDGKSSGAKKKKKKKSSDDDIVVPPMPEEFLQFKTNNTSTFDPDRNVFFDFTEPLDSVDMSKIHFSIKVDTLFQPAKFLFRPVKGKAKQYCLYAEWEADTLYRIEVDTAAFVNIYGQRCAASTIDVKVRKLEEYSTLFVNLQSEAANAVVQLLNSTDNVVKSVKAEYGKADFYFMAPGTYYMRMFNDFNQNGVWDTGDYDEQLLPETVYYYPEALTLKAQWEVSQDWNPLSIPLAKQKPEKITKQKAEKAKKSTRERNEERMREKREGKNGNKRNDSYSNGNGYNYN